MCKTIGDFVAFILQTDIKEAGEWLKSFVTRYNDNRLDGHLPWESYCKIALTSETVGHVADIFSTQVHFLMAKQPKKTADELRLRGLEFLQEIYEKAVELCIEVNREDIVWMIDEKIAQRGNGIKKSA